MLLFFLISDMKRSPGEKINSKRDHYGGGLIKVCVNKKRCNGRDILCSCLYFILSNIIFSLKIKMLAKIRS